jgi:hypothetical protein
MFTEIKREGEKREIKEGVREPEHGSYIGRPPPFSVTRADLVGEENERNRLSLLGNRSKLKSAAKSPVHRLARGMAQAGRSNLRVLSPPPS